MILTFLEIRVGKIKKSSLEALSEAVRKARELGVPVEAAVIGNEIKGIEAAVDGYGAVKVYFLESPELQAYSSQGYTLALEALVRETNPLAIFFPAPHSFTGEDVLELQAHGGPLVLQLLLARCIEVAQQTDSKGLPVLPGLRMARLSCARRRLIPI